MFQKRDLMNTLNMNIYCHFYDKCKYVNDACFIEIGKIVGYDGI